MAMTALAIGAVAAPIVGGVVGNLMGQGDRDAARAAYQRAYAQYANINIPDEEKQRLALQSPEVQGILQPFMEQAQSMGPSAMEDVNTDPRLKQAQMQALETLSKMGAEGLTAEDKMQLNSARRQVANDERSRQEAILQNMAQRGVGGSGIELATRLSAAQDAADRSSQESDRIMAMAQNRMLQAVSSAGGLGGQIRGQDFGEQTDVARAKDAIAQFNAQQSAGTQARNVATQNASAAQNLAEKQRVHEAGIGTENTEQQYNKQLAQQTFNNQMALASARANAAIGQGNMYQSQAQQTANMWGGIGSGAGTGLMGAAMLQKPGAPATDPNAHLNTGTQATGAMPKKFGWLDT